jgi:monoamine oxidase
MHWDVVVVGGGVAGLAAAGRVAQAGRSVVLLEARARLGGRIHTVFDPALGHPIELGAEFIQGNPEQLFQIIEHAGLALHEVPERHERAPGIRRRRLPGAEELVSRLLASAGPDLPDVPVAQLVRERATRFTPDEIEAMTAYLEGFHGADLERFGTAALAENQAAEEADGEWLFRISGGYGKLVAQLASGIDSKVAQVRTGTVATRLRWRPGAVEVEMHATGGEIVQLTGSQAILAVPLSTLKVHRELEGAVRVDPVPPGWEKAFGALEMGATQRIDLRFETAWWMERNRIPPIFVHGRAEPFPVWWTTSPPDLPFLTGWVGGPRAVALAGKTQDQMVRLALQSVSSIFGLDADTLAGWLRAAYSHDWTSDPFARGSYSYGGVGASSARETLRAPVAGTLFLTGEALADEGRNATVTGALTSGLRAAAALLKVPVASFPH